MGETVDSYRGAKLLGSSRLLLEVCGGFLQEGESIDATHQKRPAFLLDK